MKKPSLIILFLTVLLLFGFLLRAASKKNFTIEKTKDTVTFVEVKKDMELFPGTVFL